MAVCASASPALNRQLMREAGGMIQRQYRTASTIVCSTALCYAALRLVADNPVVNQLLTIAVLRLAAGPFDRRLSLCISIHATNRWLP